MRVVNCPLCGADVELYRGRIPYHLQPRRRSDRGHRGCEGPDATTKEKAVEIP